jgi:hypothetical protein
VSAAVKVTKAHGYFVDKREIVHGTDGAARPSGCR